MSSARIWSAIGLTAFALAASHAALAAPIVVYDNTATATTGSWAPYGFRGFWHFSPDPIGDQITLLAGTDRTITEFHLLLSSTAETTLSSLTLSFYKNDGLDSNLNPGAPGTQLWTTTVNDVLVNGPITVVFGVPNVIVPDTFTWMAGAESDVAGLATYNSPTIGSSDDTYWDRDSFDGEWYRQWLAGDPVANFGARVLAIPEPAMMSLLVLGGLAIAWRKRYGTRTVQ